jgi:hypothetical protein
MDLGNLLCATPASIGAELRGTIQPDSMATNPLYDSPAGSPGALLGSSIGTDLLSWRSSSLERSSLTGRLSFSSVGSSNDADDGHIMDQWVQQQQQPNGVQKTAAAGQANASAAATVM